MGMHDRDWYRELQKERELEKTKAKFAGYTRETAPRPFKRKLGQTSLLGMIVFWTAVMGLLYWGMKHYQQVKPAQIIQAGVLSIPRSPDGHFYVQGAVNGVSTTFMVDTGASLVTVSEPFARKAHIQLGMPITFHTANGNVPGRLADRIPVSIGGDSVPVSIGIGLNMEGEQAESLLGQSFLSRFDVSMEKDKMVLRTR
jgi:aspartyl protease family protein